MLKHLSVKSGRKRVEQDLKIWFRGADSVDRVRKKRDFVEFVFFDIFADVYFTV